MRTKKEFPAESEQAFPATEATPAEPTARHARSDAAKELTNAKNAQKAKLAQTRAAAKAAPQDEPAEEVGTETLTEALEKTQPKYRRRTSRGTRRGRYRMAAMLGLVVLFFAIIGVIAAGFLGVQLVTKATDRTDLMNELAEVAAPLIEYQPTTFSSIDKADQAVLLQAAIYRITEAERIRQLREGTDTYAYERDDYGRIILSLKEVNESYALLFGKDATPHHQTLGKESGVAYTFEYDKTNACYHVPVSISSSLYVTLTDRIDVRGNTTRIRVGYALASKLGYDNRGHQLNPTAADVDYYQWFSFVREDGHWIITAVSDS